MKCSMSIIIALVVLIITEGAYLPNYIIPCKKSDPKFQECALQNAKIAIPYLVQGDKKLKIRPLEPLDIPEIDINTSGHLKVHMKNSKLYGLGKMEIKNMIFDVEKQFLNFEFVGPRFDIEGIYNISGQILILPITGSGLLKASLYETQVGYSFKYELVQRNGKEYISPQPASVTLSAKKSSYNLENLFNGDKQLGVEMNKFLNENDDVMLKEIGPSIRETISAIAQDIVKKILTIIPYDDIILP